MTRLSSIQRREFALFAQRAPDLSKMTTAQRQSVASFLGISPAELESAHAQAWQQAPPPPPQPAHVGPTAEDWARMSPVDRRAYAVRQR